MRSSPNGSERPRATTDAAAEFGFGADDDGWIQHVQEALAPSEFGAIGPYEILAEVARGGQGVVYRARQSRTGREIALKRLVEGRFATPAAHRRFHREVEAAASLQHPGVVPVYGMEIVDGTPVLAMQWIEGQHLDQWARSKSGSERRETVLRLFLGVCDAVEHAHRNGILHLDLKPSNVLVDTDGHPYVLDFGLALFLEPEIDVTRSGAFLGTLTYASPEQLQGARRTLDARSDVYSLGVMLFELLTGKPPYDFEAGLSPAIAAQELGTLPVTGMLGAELRAVVHKALAPDRAERYATVAALAEDVRRLLDGRPILAHPPGLVYELRKFAQRNAGITALASLLFVLVVAFAVYAWRQAQLLEAERDAEGQARYEAEQAGLLAADAERRWRESAGQAEEAAEKAREAEALASAEAATSEDVLDFLLEDVFERGLVGSDEAFKTFQGDISLYEFLGAASERATFRFSERPTVEARVRTALGSVYRRLGFFAESETELRRGLELLPAEDEHLEARAWLAYRLAMTLAADARDDDAMKFYDEALAAYEGAGSTSWMMLADLLYARGSALLRLERIEECLESHMRGRQVVIDHLSSNPLRLLTAQMGIGVAEARLGNLDEARRLYDDALELARSQFGNDASLVADILGFLSDVDQAEGDSANAKARSRESLRILRKIYGDDHPLVAAGYGDLGEILTGPGELEEGEQLIRRAIEISEARREPDSVITAIHRCRLGMNLVYQRRTTDAIDVLEETLAYFREFRGEDFRWTFTCRESLSKAYAQAGRYSEAETELRVILERYAELEPIHHAGRIKLQLYKMLHFQGRRDEALMVAKEAVDFSQGYKNGPDVITRGVVAWYRARGDDASADEMQRFYEELTANP